jgi:hypothetical protein
MQNLKNEKKTPHRWLLLHAYQRMNAIWMFKKGKFCLVIKDKSFPLGNRLPLFFNKIFGNKMCQT